MNNTNKTIQFDDGAINMTINGKCTISFNPTDQKFIVRMLDTFKQLGELQGQRASVFAGGEDMGEMHSRIEEQDNAMREMLDRLFNAPVCEDVFGDKDLACLSGGMPLWCHLMLGVFDEAKVGLEAAGKEVNPALAKYLDKYKG